MRRLLLSILLIGSIGIPCQEFYPLERSYVVENWLSTGLVSGSREGVAVVSGVDFYYPFYGVKLGTIGAYSGNNLMAGIRGGYKLLKSRWVGITGELGAATGFSIDNRKFNPDLIIGMDVDLHIVGSHLLVINPYFGVNLSDSSDYGFSFLMGIKDSNSGFFKVPPVDYSIRLSSDLFSPDGDDISDILTVFIDDIKNRRSVDKWSIVIYDDRDNLIYSYISNEKLPSEFNWNGILYNGELISSARDYRVLLKVIDLLGNRIIKEREFVTDILVEKRDEDRIIKIDSIIFPPNSDKFDLLPKDQINKNRVIIHNIAEKLQKFPDYEIVIEGYGNIISPDTTFLVELTRLRALAIKNELIKEGLREDRISIVGRGGDDPVVKYDDIENWRNRRVEFILLKSGKEASSK